MAGNTEHQMQRRRSQPDAEQNDRQGRQFGDGDLDEEEGSALDDRQREDKSPDACAHTTELFHLLRFDRLRHACPPTARAVR